MASADFSQFVVTTDRAPPVRPHGISPEPFPVYSPDLRIEVTVAFGTLMSIAISSAQYALISGFCPSSHGFAIASSRLYLTIQTLQVALRFVGNYAPRDFHPRFGACPSYNIKRLDSSSRFYLCQHADFAAAIATADFSRTPQLLILLYNMTIAKKVSNVLVYCQLHSNSAVFRNSHLYRIAWNHVFFE